MAADRAGFVANATSSGIPAAGAGPGSSIPAAGDVELAVDHRVPGPGGVGEIDRDLGVLDPPGRAGVLALHPDRADTLLQVPGLVDHQHRVAFAEMGDHELTQI